MKALTCALAVAVVVAGCARQGNGRVAATCREGPGALRTALAAAPGEVRLGGTPLSACIKGTSNGGEMLDVGAAYLTVATELAAKARRRPDGVAAVRLGYLIGAVERSSKRSQGAGYELTRRLRQELVPVDTRSRAFRRGRRAGLATG